MAAGITIVAAGAPARVKAALITERGVRVEFPFAPQDVTRKPGGIVWRESDRPGAKPLLTASGLDLDTITCDWLHGYPDPQQSIEADLIAFRDLRRVSDRVRFAYGVGEQGWWRVSGLQIDVTQRTLTDDASRARITLDLIEASDALVLIHPIAATNSGNVTPPAAPAGAAAATAPTGERTVTVHAGETLAAIAARELGNASRWREIADLNGITNPNRVTVGTVLKLPA